MVQGYAQTDTPDSSRRYARRNRIASPVGWAGAAQDSPRIAITVAMTNGVFIKRKNLSYDNLVKFVEKLEALC